MRCLDPDFARRAYPLAVAALPRPADVTRIVYFDCYVYLLSDSCHGYSTAYWLPINKLWVPYVRRLA